MQEFEKYTGKRENRKTIPQEEAEKIRESEREAGAHAVANSEEGERLKKEIDDILNEIDEVLIENAEQFVRDYVQKGGQ